MNFKEFTEASKRTAPFNGEPQNHIEHEHLMANYSMGLLGESVELLEEVLVGSGLDAKKEMGDVAHYACILGEVVGLKFDFELRKMDMTTTDTLTALTFAAKQVSEVSKKYVFHRHEFNAVDYRMPLKFILQAIYSLCEQWGLKLSEVLEGNIDKLKERYPEKFDTEKSINR
jgi:NTP pyrophosphatase (non-canonical NTP hydrolase)